MTAHSRTGAGNTKEYVAEMLRKCEQGVEACRTSEGFLQYLKAQAKFHNYSYNNSMLIASQMPEATYVAGYRSWQAFSTPDNPVYVRKGEKAIYILAPAPYKKTVEVTDADGNAVLNPDGRAKTEERIVQSFRPTYVFDISQVEGIDESVLNPCKILEGEVKEYELLRTAIESVSDAPIDYITIKGDAKGYYSPTQHRIAVQQGMFQPQTIKTLLHEIAHSRLHGLVDPEKEAIFQKIGTEDLDEIAVLSGYESYRAMYEDDKRIEGLEEITPSDWEQYQSYGITRAMKETQAEATAFIVAEYYGIDASDYSFSYLATWGDAKSSELKESLKVIQRASGKLIDEIDAEIMRQRLLHTDAIAYRINGYGYLQLERNQEGGYDYQLRSNKLQVIESGHVTTDLQIDEAAKEIASKHDIHSYRLREFDTEKLMTQLADRDEAIKTLARDIATQLKLVDDQTEPAEREAIEARVGADIEAGRGDIIDSLRALAHADKRCEELMDQTEQYIDLDVVATDVATIQIA